MHKKFYLFAWLTVAAFGAGCQEDEPPLDPTRAYLGDLTCTLVARTSTDQGRTEVVDTKQTAGSLTKVADHTLALNLATFPTDAGLRIPLLLGEEAVAIPGFSTVSNRTVETTTTYLSTYYVGKGRLEDKKLSLTLDYVSYQTIGTNGNEEQHSSGNATCDCVKK